MGGRQLCSIVSGYDSRGRRQYGAILSHNVSHELRTPLTSLLGFIETLRGPASEDRAALSFLGIMEQAERMHNLVSNVAKPC
jgi:two-component system phosphate regulon sensor histidine kinase PhoR